MENVVDDIAAPVIMVGFPLVVAWLIVTLHRDWTRKKIAQTGASPELVESLFRRKESPSRFVALKWGIVAVALGLGVSVEAILPYDFQDPVAYGVIFVCGGLGLILYYLFVERWLGAGSDPDRSRPSLGRDYDAEPRGGPRP